MAGLLTSAVLLIAAAYAPAAQAFTARGSVEQVQVTEAKAGTRLVLIDRRGGQVAVRRAGSLGAALFRHVRAGGGYRVRPRSGGAPSPPFRVLPDRSAPPSTKPYDQAIPAGGYGYLTTRDGTQLAINVHLPGPADQGPYPTLVEYSGYGYANPAGGQSSIAQIGTVLGYAVVDVNMRGTGCSGGAFDFFEPLQSLDGYDVIETVARQPWAMHHKVGMMGISYGGISQLFVGATRPPSLAAITPLSVIDSTATTLYPGGILNTGFALSWAKDRVHDARPASNTGGQKWALDRIRQGDQTCKANQALHEEAVDLIAKIRANRYYVPSVADPVAPATFVHRIKSPVFLACQWTDEQTGGHCPDSGVALHRHAPQVVHVHQRHPRRLAGPGDLHALVRLPRALCGSPRAESLSWPAKPGADHLPDRHGHPRGAAARRSDPGAVHLRGRARGLREPARGPHPVRQRRGQLDARRARSEL